MATETSNLNNIPVFSEAAKYLAAFDQAFGELWSSETIEAAAVAAKYIRALYGANEHLLQSVKELIWAEYNENWQAQYRDIAALNGQGMIYDPSPAFVRERIAAYVKSDECIPPNYGLGVWDTATGEKITSITNPYYFAASTPKFLFALLFEGAVEDYAKKHNLNTEEVFAQNAIKFLGKDFSVDDLRACLVEATKHGANPMQHLSQSLDQYLDEVGAKHFSSADQAKSFWSAFSDDEILALPFTLYDLMAVTLVESGNKTLELMRIITSKLSESPLADDYLVSSWQLHKDLKDKLGVENFSPNAGLEFIYLQSHTNTADIEEIGEVFHNQGLKNSKTMKLLRDINLDFGFSNLMTIKDKLQEFFPGDEILGIEQKTGLFPLQRWNRFLATAEGGSNPTHLAHSFVGTIVFKSGRRVTISAYIHLPVPNVPDMSTKEMANISESNQVMIQEAAKDKLATMVLEFLSQIYSNKN